MSDHRICLLSGDGIGPEISAEATRVAEHVAADAREMADAVIAAS